MGLMPTSGRRLRETSKSIAAAPARPSGFQTPTGAETNSGHRRDRIPYNRAPRPSTPLWRYCLRSCPSATYAIRHECVDQRPSLASRSTASTSASPDSTEISHEEPRPAVETAAAVRAIRKPVQDSAQRLRIIRLIEDAIVLPKVVADCGVTNRNRRHPQGKVLEKFQRKCIVCDR